MSGTGAFETLRSGVKTLVAQDLGDSGPVMFRDLGIPFGVQTPQSHRREMNETRVKGLKDYLLQTFTRRHYEVPAYYMADIIIAPDQREKMLLPGCQTLCNLTQQASNLRTAQPLTTQ